MTSLASGQHFLTPANRLAFFVDKSDAARFSQNCINTSSMLYESRDTQLNSPCFVSSRFTVTVTLMHNTDVDFSGVEATSCLHEDSGRYAAYCITFSRPTCTLQTVVLIF